MSRKSKKPIARPKEAPKAKSKPSAVSTPHQSFDGEQARRDAMAMFSGERNNYTRVAGNKWKKTKKT